MTLCESVTACVKEAAIFKSKLYNLMKQKRLLKFLVTATLNSFLLLGCGKFAPQSTIQTTESLSGFPSTKSESVYQTNNLNELCNNASCDSQITPIPSWFQESSTTNNSVCNFDYNPNASSQFILKTTDNWSPIYLSKVDLFFIAWVSHRYKINPHFLMAILRQESGGNCSLVSVAEAEGCFQITNYWGRRQLQQSYSDRTSSWFWTANPPASRYDSSLFVNPQDWFEDNIATTQYRVTLDPESPTVNGTEVSSVVNFHFGSIGSALFFHWQNHFLWRQKSIQDTLKKLIQTESSAKSKLMAAAYNGGTTKLIQSIKNRGINYDQELFLETSQYVSRVFDFCKKAQSGDLVYNATLNQTDVDDFITYLEQTYELSLFDAETLRTQIRQDFFTDTDELTIVDDIKALIFTISRFSPTLAPHDPEDL